MQPRSLVDRGARDFPPRNGTEREKKKADVLSRARGASCAQKKKERRGSEYRTLAAPVIRSNTPRGPVPANEAPREITIR